MSQTFGIESPDTRSHQPEQPPVRYVVLIESQGAQVARLYLADHAQVAEFQGGAEEVNQIVGGLVPKQTAHLPEWDAALAGSSDAERRAAQVFKLAI